MASRSRGRALRARRIPLLLLLALSAPLPVLGDGPTEVLVAGLAGAIDLAASPAASGGVLIAQQRGDTAVAYWAPGYTDAKPLVAGPPAELESPAAKPTAIAFLSPTHFVVAWRDQAAAAAVSLHEFNPLDSPSDSVRLKSIRRLDAEELPGGGSLLACLARGEKFLYTCGGTPARLLRARHNAGLLSRFRVVSQLDRPATACCETPEGYLLATVDASIVFFNPAEPDSPPLVTYDTGLDQISAVAYGQAPRPYSRLLYVLGEGRGSAAKPGRRPAGLYRLDAGLDTHDRPTCDASLVLAADGLVAMSFAADGGLLLVQAEDNGSARLLRVADEL
ncbi:hypothetical protein Pla123a_30070 [Posidoniimonas polymericola]|uniref:Uncharacterized protein n=1 Tax=Posidoniimonas polymericola TaxID=2528002 RepID=A0A5C5YL17_9BACT|nr:hypothetical protein [Posidoniimonas polymericola]TWT75498.1 hypothetical protein Pla123a_30070 [Posidoniimonas polymericola]